MHRFRKLLLATFLGWVMLAQNASLMMNPNVRRVGTKLACLCGACKNSVGDCPMMGCHYSLPGRERIEKMQAAGASDENIISKFVEQEGLKALVVPPASGFSLAAWVMPFVMILMGLFAIYAYIQRFRKPAPAIPLAVSDRHRELAAKDIEKLD